MPRTNTSSPDTRRRALTSARRRPGRGAAVTGPDYRWILPYSAVLGGVVLLGADVVGRIVTAPGELQVGIMTAVVGAPVLVALVRRSRVSEL